MKKLLFTLVALITVFSAKAFEFDGIDLNAKYLDVAREVAAKGYVFDNTKGCLTGQCQGQEVFLYFNVEDVKEKTKIGQLIVEFGMPSANSSIKDVTNIFNIIYHQTKSENGVTSYLVDKDGTTLDVTSKGNNIVLTYSTPNYKAKK